MANMSAYDFTAWVNHMRVAEGIESVADFCRLLDISAPSFYAYKNGGAPKRIGLACNALYHGLPPWTAARYEKETERRMLERFKKENTPG